MSDTCHRVGLRWGCLGDILPLVKFHRGVPQEQLSLKLGNLESSSFGHRKFPSDRLSSYHNHSLDILSNFRWQYKPAYNAALFKEFFRDSTSPRWHFLYFLSLPQGHGSFLLGLRRAIFMISKKCSISPGSPCEYSPQRSRRALSIPNLFV